MKMRRRDVAARCLCLSTNWSTTRKSQESAFDWFRWCERQSISLHCITCLLLRTLPPCNEVAVHHACSLIATWMLFSIYSVSPSHICPWRSCIFLIKASSSVKMFLIISKSIKLQSLLFKLMDCCRIFQHWKNINKAVAEKIWYWNVVRLIFFFHKRTTHWLILFHSYVLPSFSVASALSVQRLALTLWSKKTFYC